MYINNNINTFIFRYWSIRLKSINGVNKNRLKKGEGNIYFIPPPKKKS
jgi:hypothetical protein